MEKKELLKRIEALEVASLGPLLPLYNWAQTQPDGELWATCPHGAGMMWWLEKERGWEEALQAVVLVAEMFPQEEKTTNLLPQLLVPETRDGAAEELIRQAEEAWRIIGNGNGYGERHTFREKVSLQAARVAAQFALSKRNADDMGGYAREYALFSMEQLANKLRERWPAL